MNKEKYDPVMTWERLVTAGVSGRTFRCPVPGGWLVRVDDSVEATKADTNAYPGGSAGVGMGVGLTFLPDPKHTWDGWSVEVGK